MGQDQLICGTCRLEFNIISEFIEHKTVCQREEAKNSNPSNSTQLFPAQNGDSSVYESLGDIEAPDGPKQEQQHVSSMLDARELPQGSCVQSYYIVKSDTTEGPLAHITLCETQLKNSDSLLMGDAATIDSVSVNSVPAARKRGRPRKDKNKVTPDVIELPGSKEPILGEDGLYHCDECKRSFKRLRHINNHRCSVWQQCTTESNLPKPAEIQDADLTVQCLVESLSVIKDKSLDSGTSCEERPVEPATLMETSDTMFEPAVNASTDLTEGIVNNLDASLIEAQAVESQAVQESHAAPLTHRKHQDASQIFTSEVDRLQFEQCLNVDLSGLDAMYETQIVEQQLNENAVNNPRALPKSLYMYWCSKCQKVFKSQCQIRAHVLTHTDLKPYKCFKCDFATNIKGNLYTHMRRHTGQYFYCSFCPFTSINRSHVVDHEATHSKIRQTCEICQKTYKTVKSLMNHIRFYHKNSDAGKKYLATFQGKHSKGIAVIHQCHVCNMKFKKKSDRDRHLFVHGVSGEASVISCELCSYKCSRQSYLEKHYKKHRLLYVCAVCHKKHCSTIRLKIHLIETHSATEQMLPDLFTRSIEQSLYLPEPVLNVGEKTYLVNNDTREVETGEDLVGTQRDDAGAGKFVDGGAESLSLDCTVLRDDKPAEAYIEGIENSSPNEKSSIAPEDLEISTSIVNKLQYRAMTMELYLKFLSLFGSIECEDCGRLFFSKNIYENHVRVHTGDRPFACSQCSYRGISTTALRLHKEQEHDKLTYVCNKCDHIANSRTQLWYHQQKHKEKSTICPTCNVQFINLKQLKIHLRMKHPEMNPAQIKQLTGISHKPQARIGRRYLHCPYCSKSFLRTTSDLQRHMWMHEGIAPFKCDKCDYSCRSKSHLNSHMIRHSSLRPFMCKVCRKPYKSRTALRWHVRSHLGTTYKCNKCKYRGTQLSYLRRHMETHNIVKRYSCAYCSYSANTIGSLKIHSTRIHPGLTFISHDQSADIEQHITVYKCMHCDYIFKQSADLQRHLLAKHHVGDVGTSEAEYTNKAAIGEHFVEEMDHSPSRPASTHAASHTVIENAKTSITPHTNSTESHHSQLTTVTNATSVAAAVYCTDAPSALPGVTSSSSTVSCVGVQGDIPTAVYTTHSNTTLPEDGCLSYHRQHTLPTDDREGSREDGVFDMQYVHVRTSHHEDELFYTQQSLTSTACGSESEGERGDRSAKGHVRSVECYNGPQKDSSMMRRDVDSFASTVDTSSLPTEQPQYEEGVHVNVDQHTASVLLKHLIGQTSHSDLVQEERAGT